MSTSAERPAPGALRRVLLAAACAAAAAARAQDSPPEQAGAPAPGAAGEPPASTSPAVTVPAAAASPGRVGAAELVPLGGHSDDIVVTVGDVALRRSDVFRVLDLAAPGKSAEVIRQMVLSTAAQLEAQREGIDVPAEELEQQIEAAISEQKASFALEVDESLPLEEYLSLRHGISPEDYRAEVRRMVLASLLLERAVRLDQRRMDRDELQVIVVQDEALAQDIRRQLDEGASFAVLAKKHSVHPSAGSGGELPPMPSGGDVPLVAGRGTLQPGELLGPAVISADDQSWWRIVRLIDRQVADETPWLELRDAIEAGLAERPMQPDELAIFEDRMVDRYRVSRPGRSP